MTAGRPPVKLLLLPPAVLFALGGRAVLAESPGMDSFWFAVLSALPFATCSLAVYRPRWPMCVMLCGTALNFLALGANGGFMPVAPTLFDDGPSLVHIQASIDSRLIALCDVLPPGGASIGDYLILLGLITCGVYLVRDHGRAP